MASVDEDEDSYVACSELLRADPLACERREQHAHCATHCEPIHDAFNDFGMHALAADDPAWSAPEYRALLAAHGSGRLDSHLARLPIVSGPVHPRLFYPHLQALLGSGYALRAVVGSGSDAVHELFVAASASNPRARLLWLRGGYLSGYSTLQNANAIDDIRDYAYARSDWHESYAVDGPYVRCVECDCPSCAGDEARALRLLHERVAAVQAKGEVVVGVLFEGVRAKDGHSLRPAFVSALRQWLDARALLLLEDAVLTGLRTGYPFLSGHYYTEAQADFVAVGKAYGFSGVIENLNRRNATSMEALRARQAVAARFLNGYRTMPLSALDVLRAGAVLRAVHERGLLANAREAGLRLRRHLQESGLRVWGLGLLLWFDRTSGCPANVLTTFDRLMPPLTFGARDGELESVRVGSRASRRVLVELSTRVAMMDEASTMSEDDELFFAVAHEAAGEYDEEGAELPGYDEREARARGFAASEQRGRETGDVSWNCANATCSCLEFRPPYT